jgi:hypothetical protein
MHADTGLRLIADIAVIAVIADKHSGIRRAA